MGAHKKWVENLDAAPISVAIMTSRSENQLAKLGTIPGDWVTTVDEPSTAAELDAICEELKLRLPEVTHHGRPLVQLAATD